MPHTTQIIGPDSHVHKLTRCCGALNYNAVSWLESLAFAMRGGGGA